MTVLPFGTCILSLVIGLIVGFIGGVIFQDWMSRETK